MYSGTVSISLLFTVATTDTQAQEKVVVANQKETSPM
jgi:hypothetical protein